jgi:large subunit ribosomal protein L1
MTRRYSQKKLLIKEPTYSVLEGIKLLKKINLTRFDASVDLSVRLSVAKKQTLQTGKSTLLLPYGNGKKVKILVIIDDVKSFTTKEKNIEVMEIGKALEFISEKNRLPYN